MKNLYSSVSLFRCVNHLKVIGLMCFLSLSLTDTFLGQSKKEQILILALRCDSLLAMSHQYAANCDSLRNTIDHCQKLREETAQKDSEEINKLIKQIEKLNADAKDNESEKKHLEEQLLRLLARRDSIENSKISVGKVIKVGEQFWLSENLDVSNFRNGDLILHARSNDDWEKAGSNGQPAWCYYNNNASYGKKYGKLYNFYAVNDPRGLAPAGWHIPTEEEWDKIGFSLSFDVAQKMKSKDGWGG